MTEGFSVGIVGATGFVGQTFQKLLSHSDYDFKELRFFASLRTKGQKINFRDREYEIQNLCENCFRGLDLVFFSSGDSISRQWAPLAVKQGVIVVDNSAAHRMIPNTPLIVPEINFDEIKNPAKPKIIANPNCSTIQLAMVLNALKKFNPLEVRVASYQSVSGAGRDGIRDLSNQSRDILSGREPRPGLQFDSPIAFECQPKIGFYNDRFFCSEEVKIMMETKKILSLPNLKISAFTVRVPTLNGHGEALWLTLDKDVDIYAIESAFNEAEGICYLKQKKISKNPADGKPLSLKKNKSYFGYNKSFHSYKEISGSSDVFVSRLRKDMDFEKTWMMWIVADNLYRGAASNGFFIAERIFDKFYLT